MAYIDSTIIYIIYYGNDQIYKLSVEKSKYFEISAPTEYTFALYIIRNIYLSNSALVEHATHYTTVFP